jgi:hypothetical protein
MEKQCFTTVVTVWVKENTQIGGKIQRKIDKC